MSLNQVTITDRGLLNINRKIIDERKFSQNLITTVGSPTVEGAIVSDLSATSYFQKNDLSFENGTLTIAFEGTYLSSLSGTTQTAWHLSSGNSYIYFQFVNNRPQLILPYNLSIPFDIDIPDDTNVRVIVTIKPDKVEALINIDADVFSDDVTLPSPIDISLFKTLTIGNNPNTTSNFWVGSIDLKRFYISENYITKFTPTTGYSLNFSHIVVSDGKFPLSDTPFSSSGHSYIYGIDEITRSSNTLLLTSQLDEDSKLVIREIGLYAKEYVEGEGEKEFLFGYIKNLNIDKGAEVPYDLILTVDLTISVVNVVGFPDYNSFILEEVTPALLKNFTTVRDANAYAIGNLERIIRNNSLKSLKTTGYIGKSSLISKNLNPPPLYKLEPYEDGIKCCGYELKKDEQGNMQKVPSSPDYYYAWSVTVDGNKNLVYTRQEAINDLDTPLYDNFFTIVEKSSEEFHIIQNSESFYIVYGSSGLVAYRDSSYDLKTETGNMEAPAQCHSIGYNTPQVVYRAQKTIAEQEDCYSAIQTYSKLYKRLHYSSESIFKQDSVITNGNINIPNSGIVTNFTINDYLEMSNSIEGYKDWSMKLCLSLNSGSSSTQCFLSLSNTQTITDEDTEETITEFTPFLSLNITENNKLSVSTTATVSPFDKTLEVNKKYYIKLNYTYNSTPTTPISINLLISEDDMSYTELASISDLPAIENINQVILGVDATINEAGVTATFNPFTNGTLYLMECSMLQSGNNWNPVTERVLQDKQLLHYYHIPNYLKYSATIHDICDFKYYLGILDGTLTGNGDLISLANNESTSLCVKVNLKNDKSKVIIAKVDPEKNVLFKLEFLKVKINEYSESSYYFKFTVRTINEGTIINQEFLSSATSALEVNDYIKSPFLLSVIIDNSGYVSIYRNNELFISNQLNYSTPSYEGSYLTNSIGDNTEPGIYVQDIIAVKGAISPEQLYYITNLTDTNYRILV